MSKYHYTRISDISSGTSDTKKAVVVPGSERLVVAHSDGKYDVRTVKIFSIMSRRPIIDARFSDIDDAIVAAQLLERIYVNNNGECLLDILEADPEIDVLFISRYTVDNGEQIYNNLHELESRLDTITLEDMKRALMVTK